MDAIDGRDNEEENGRTDGSCCFNIAGVGERERARVGSGAGTDRGLGRGLGEGDDRADEPPDGGSCT